jgi:hypothetical protein
MCCCVDKAGKVDHPEEAATAGWTCWRTASLGLALTCQYQTSQLQVLSTDRNTTFSHSGSDTRCCILPFSSTRKSIHARIITLTLLPINIDPVPATDSSKRRQHRPRSSSITLTTFRPQIIPAPSETPGNVLSLKAKKETTGRCFPDRDIRARRVTCASPPLAFAPRYACYQTRTSLKTPLASSLHVDHHLNSLLYIPPVTHRTPTTRYPQTSPVPYLCILTPELPASSILPWDETGS